MRAFKVASLLIILLLLPDSSIAQINVDIQPTQITIGDPIELTISLAAPEEGSIIWPGPEELAPAEIIRLDTLDLGENEEAVRYTLSYFEPGEFELSNIPVIISRTEDADTLRVNPGKILVASVIDPADSTADIKDIHPPIKLAWTLRDLLPYIIILASLLILGIIGYLLWRKWKIRRGEIVLPEPPAIPPHVIALDRLQELRIKKLWQNGYLKEYYSELSEIVKEYIGGRYNINALEMTTYELVEKRWKWGREEDCFRLINRILNWGDLVKFARYKANPNENENSLNYAFEYIDATKKAAEQLVPEKKNIVEAMLEDR